MLSNEMNYITLSGKEYPIRCDMLVLEKIQDAFGDVSEFENKLMGFTPSVDKNGETKKDAEGRTIGISGIPDIRALKVALYEMIKEGTEVDGTEFKEKPETLLRAADMTPRELSIILHGEFMRCFQRKNQGTTQNKEMKKQSR